MRKIAELLPPEYRAAITKKVNQMTFRIEKSTKLGFCFGVRRAIDMMEKVARERAISPLWELQCITSRYWINWLNSVSA